MAIELTETAAKEIKQIITSQDRSIRRWASGPASGAFDCVHPERSRPGAIAS